MKSSICHALAWAVVLPLGAQTVDGFNPNANESVRAIAVQSDGKVIIGGTFTTVGGVARSRLARLHPDGTLDATFTNGANDRILSLAVQGDDKILLGGAFTTVGGLTRTYLARLDSNGTVDTGFAPSLNNWVRDIAIQSDNRILVGGSFTTMAAQPRNFLGRLEATGALDTTFNPGASAQVNTLVVEPDGQIVVGGFFTTLALQPRNYIGRINANGSADTTFNPNAGNTVWRLALQNDGKILVGGAYGTMGGQVRSNLARLLPTGALDTTFNPNANSIVNSLLIRTNGNIIAAGNFTALGLQPRNYLASILPDGSLDPGFVVGANATLYALCLQNNDRLLVGGDFTTLGPTNRNRIGRIHFGPSNDDFANSAALVGNDHFVLTENLRATAEPGEPQHYRSEAISSLWWSWMAQASGPVSIDTTGSEVPPAVAVYFGNALTNLTLVVSNYSPSSFDPGGARVAFQATAGQVYRIALDSFEPQGMLTFHLRAAGAPGAANDFFANATVIPIGTLSVSGNNAFATREPGEPQHSGNSVSRSLWWSWTAQTNGPVTLDLAGTAFSPRLVVYSGTTLNNLNLVAQSSGSGEPSVTFQAAAGTTYRIAVESEFPNGIIHLNFRQRPANDNFANRVELRGATFTTAGENRLATEEPNEPNHANASGTKSVWWYWTAPSTGRFTLDTSGSSIIPALAVYTGTAFPLTPVTYHDGSSASASRVTFSAAQNTTYQFAVDANSSFIGGDIVLNLAPSRVYPGNDNFVDRIEITQFPAALAGSNVDATTEQGELTPDSHDNTLWWQFIAPSNGVATVSKVSGVPALRFLALEGPDLSTLRVLANNFINVPPFRHECAITFSVRAGNTYFISVGTVEFWLLDEGDFQVNLDLTPAPLNDNFASPVVVPPNTPAVTGSTVAATVEPGEPPATNSIWYSFTPAVSGPVILTTAGSTFDTVLAVYTGSVVNNLSRVAANDAAYTWDVLAGPPADSLSRLKFNALAGQPYRISISTVNRTVGDAVLNFPTLAIEDIVSITPVLQPDRTTTFTALLRLANLRLASTGPLRLRLLARAGFSQIERASLNCGKHLPSMNVPDQELAIFHLSSPDFLSAQSSIVTPVSGVCPPPYEAGDWGQGWGVTAVLEEDTNSNGWEVRDSRLLLFGNWPRVNGFSGPGGGVVTVASGIGQILPSVGFIDVTIGPPAAVRRGAMWRVSPTNFGSLGSYTNFTNRAFVLATRTNNFSIEVANPPGFIPPTNRTIQLLYGKHTPLDLIFSVRAGLLYHRNTGLSITSAPGTAYTIQSTPALHPPVWTSNTSVTLITGSNNIPNTGISPGANRFYRALWLSD